MTTMEKGMGEIQKQLANKEEISQLLGKIDHEANEIYDNKDRTIPSTAIMDYVAKIRLLLEG